MSIGVPYDAFWHLNPTKLKAFRKAYELKRKIEDEKMWYMGQYIMCALDSTVCNNSFWKGKNGKPSNYPEKPVLANKIDVENAPLTEEEKRRKTEELFMQLKLMGANHKLKNNGNKE